MPDPNEGQYSPEEFKKVQEQVENLNKGIASYREEIKTKDEKYTKLETDFNELKTKVETKEEDEPEEKVELDPEDQKKLDVWAKQQGLVKKEDLEAERQKIHAESQRSVETQAISEFVGKYPEFEKEEEWAKVHAEFQLYKIPGTLEGYRRILDKIVKDLKGGTRVEDAKAQARAELITKGRLSLGGGRQGGRSDGSEQTVEALQAKYPNLSRDQIEARLAEINSLYPKK